MNNQELESARRATTKCMHGFSCLVTDMCGERPPCHVCGVDGCSNVLFLEPDAPEPPRVLCAYRDSVAGVPVCTCPTHYVTAKAKWEDG